MRNQFHRLRLSAVAVGWAPPTNSQHHPHRSIARCLSQGERRKPGFTLVEMLIAMAITLVMMGAVVTLFANVSNSIRNRRARWKRPTKCGTSAT